MGYLTLIPIQDSSSPPQCRSSNTQKPPSRTWENIFKFRAWSTPQFHPPSELLAEEVVGHLELGEEQDEVEELAHHEVGEVPRVVVEDRFVVLYKLLDDGFL